LVFKLGIVWVIGCGVFGISFSHKKARGSHIENSYEQALRVSSKILNLLDRAAKKP